MRTPLLAAAVLAAFVATPFPGGDANAPYIQPGDEAQTGEGYCTLSWVFDGQGALAGKVYVAIAAHCVDGLGDSVTSYPYSDFGTVAYYGNPGQTHNDFALIEVRPEHVGKVNAAVKGHPQYPIGYTTAAATSFGDIVRFSGYGDIFYLTALTQEERLGVLQSDNQRTYTLSGLTNFGDSGGPIVHVPTGKALGIISRLCVPGPCTDTGPTVEGMLVQTAQDGFPVALRTV